MKNKKQFLKIFAVAFVISLVTQILSVVILLVRPSIFLDPDYLILNLLSVLFNLVYFTIAPILMFAAFYFIGKKPNLIFELKPIVPALLVGNMASLFIGSILQSAIGMAPFEGTLFGLIAYLLPIYLLSALAGLYVGYARQSKLTSIAEPESS